MDEELASQLTATWPELPSGLAGALQDSWAEVAKDIARLPESAPPTPSHPVNKFTNGLAAIIVGGGRVDDPRLKDFLEKAVAAAGVEESWKNTVILTTVVQADSAARADQAPQA